MAILFDANLKALSRTAGTFLSNASNWTVGLWVQASTNTPSAGGYRQFYEIANAPFTAFVFLGSLANSNQLQLNCVNGLGANQTVLGPTLTLNQWSYLTITYDSATNVFTLFVDSTSVGTVTVNMSTITWTQQFLGDDGLPHWPNTVVEYFRDWQRTLTAAQILAEKNAFTAALATNLFTDTPLVVTGTLTDLSGNAHTWTAVGAIGFFSPGPLPPANISAATAIDLTNALQYAPPALNVQDASVTGGIWYKYTAKSSDTVIGFWAFGAIGGYAPQTIVLQADGVSVYLGMSGLLVNANKPIQFPVIASTAYYMKVVSVGNVSPTTLTVNALRGPSSIVAAGSLAVNSDSPGFPIALLDSATGFPLRFIVPNPTAGEKGVITTTGVLALESVDDVVSDTVRLYDANYNIIATILSPFGGPSVVGMTCDMSSTFYITGQGIATLKSFTAAGVLSATTSTLAVTGAIPMAVTRTRTILYYAASTVNAPIKRWDLVGNVALSDLVAGVATYASIPDMLVLSDGTIIVGYSGGVSGFDLVIKAYNAAGAVLQTYSLGDAGADIRLAMALDDANSFWLWTKNLTASVKTGFSRFRNIKVSNGAVLSDLPAVTEYESGYYSPAASATPADRFGHYLSCPFWLTRVTVAPSNSCVSIPSAAADPAGAAIGGTGPYGMSVTTIVGCEPPVGPPGETPGG